MAEQGKPLLDLERGAEGEWERISDDGAGGPEGGPASPRAPRFITVQELIRLDPDNVMANIKDGVIKVGRGRR
jgi:hypothetical protein